MSEKKYGPNTAEVEAYLAILPKLTGEQWEAAREAAWDASWDAAWGTATRTALGALRHASWASAGTAAWEVAGTTEWAALWAASWATVALVTRDLITPDQFDTLTAPMRAAGVNFDGLTNHNEQEQR